MENENKMSLKEHYDSWHEMPRNINPKYSYRFRHQILNRLGVEKGRRLLDIGLGSGVTLTVAEQRGLNTNGIDISETAIKNVRKISPKSKLHVADAENLPSKNDTFDYITCLGSLEHFSNARSAIREMTRVLKNDGLVIFHLPNLFFHHQVF